MWGALLRSGESNGSVVGGDDDDDDGSDADVGVGATCLDPSPSMSTLLGDGDA